MIRFGDLEEELDYSDSEYEPDYYTPPTSDEILENKKYILESNGIDENYLSTQFNELVKKYKQYRSKVIEEKDAVYEESISNKLEIENRMKEIDSEIEKNNLTIKIHSEKIIVLEKAYSKRVRDPYTAWLDAEMSRYEAQLSPRRGFVEQMTKEEIAINQAKLNALKSVYSKPYSVIPGYIKTSRNVIAESEQKNAQLDALKEQMTMELDGLQNVKKHTLSKTLQAEKDELARLTRLYESYYNKFVEVYGVNKISTTMKSIYSQADSIEVCGDGRVFEGSLESVMKKIACGKVVNKFEKGGRE